MTTYGLTATGFVPKPLLIIQAEIHAAFQAVFGASIDLRPQSVFGQLAGILAERESELWDACQEIYAAADPGTSTGASLDSICALTGTLREAASRSTVTLTLGGTDGTPVPAGSQVSVTATGVKFETLESATITAVGTFAPSATVLARALETGPLVALAGTITTIETPVDGWATVTNATDADVGSDIETDAALRLRRESELRRAGGGALEAIRTRVLDVTGVEECAVFENTTLTTDGDGLPAKSVEVVVHGTTAVPGDIRSAIFGTAADARGVAAGIETYGTVSGTVIDSQGSSHTVKYSTATELPVDLSITVTYDANEFPVDGADQLEAAILAYGAGLVMGRNVVPNAVAARAFAVSGVLDAVALVGVGTPTAATLAVGLREIAVFDSGRLTITLVAGTP